MQIGTGLSVINEEKCTHEMKIYDKQDCKDRISHQTSSTKHQTAIKFQVDSQCSGIFRPSSSVRLIWGAIVTKRSSRTKVSK
jgi:hypothetical protein